MIKLKMKSESSVMTNGYVAVEGWGLIDLTPHEGDGIALYNEGWNY